MVAAISGSGLGLYNTSATNLNGQGAAGTAPEGKTGEDVYVNTATGNLVLQDSDQVLAAEGLDVSIVRTYNSQGQFNGGVGQNWRLGVEEALSGLTGTVNTAGSTITKTFGDGATVTYTYNASLGLYTSSAGPSADDTLSFNATSQQWTWTDSTTRTLEVYGSSGQLLSSRDSSGNTVTYAYNGSQLTQITDASGQVTTFTYSGGNISQISTQSNGVTQTLVYYSYDSQGRLSQVTLALTPQDNSVTEGGTYVTTYAYQGTTDLVSSITQSDGTKISFTYQEVNGEYLVASYTDGLGNTTTLTYNETGSGGATTANANSNTLQDSSGQSSLTTGTQSTTTTYNLNTGATSTTQTSTATDNLNSSATSTTETSSTTTNYSLSSTHLTTPTVGWQTPSQLETLTYGVDNPLIAGDSSGNNVMLTTAGGNLFAQRYIEASNTVTSAVLLTTLTSTVYTPSLAVDSSGNALAAWVQSNGTTETVYAARYTASTGTWSAAVALESSSNPAQTGTGSVATAIDGQYAAVTWIQSDGTTNRLYAAQYNGTAWSAAGIIDAGNGNAAAQPTVAIDASGNVMALWQQSNGTASCIYANHFAASSGTWGGASLLESSTTAAASPTIAFDGSGNGFAAWSEGGALYEAHYSASAGTWSTPANLAANSNAVYAPSLSVDTSGDALVAWIQSNGTNPVVYAAVYTASAGTWSAASAIETVQAALPAAGGAVVTSIAGSHAVVSWLQLNGSSNYLYQATYSSGTWNAPTVVDGYGSATQPGVYIDSHGNVSNVYVTGTGQHSAAYRNGAQLVTPAPPGVEEPQIGMPASGAFMAMWVSGGAVFAQNYNPATGTLTNLAGLVWNTNPTYSPSLAVDSAGNALAAWTQLNGSNVPQLIVNRYSASSKTWAGTQGLGSSEPTATVAGSVATAIDGQYAAVAWVQSDGTTNRLYVSVYNGTSWSAATAVNAANSSSSAQPTVAIDASGNVMVLWQQSDGTASSIYANHYSAAAGTWGGATLLESSSTAAANPHLEFDGSGNGFAVWSQGGALYETHYSVSSGSWSTAVNLAPNSNTAYAPSLAVDSAGNAIVAWIQSNGTTPVVYVSSYSASGGTWSTATAVESSTAALATGSGNVTTAINGSYAAVGWIQANGSVNSLYTATLSGSTWSSPTLMGTSNGYSASQPVLAIDSTGNIDAVWQQSTTQLGILGYQRFNNDPRPYYSVTWGDTWSGIAQKLYGSTAPASELESQMGNPTLSYGLLLKGMPATESVVTTTTTTVPAYYTVVSGDTWATIAQKLYGTTAAASQLQTQLGNPALTVGAQLSNLPTTETVTTTTTVPPYYTVVSGDTWSSIAQKLYGTTAVASQLQTQLGNPALTVGAELTNLPSTEAVTTTTGTSSALYYTVKSGDTWSSITEALYGTSNANAVAALESALSSPTLTTGAQLTGFPATLSYSTTTTTTVPSSYTVQPGDTWASITQALYGTSNPNAVAALQSALGDPTLAAEVPLTGLPATLTYSQSSALLAPAYYVVQPNDTWGTIALAVYGTSDPAAAAALQSALGSPTLSAGEALTVPTSLTYTPSAAGSYSTQTTITDALGNTTTLVNDSSGRLVEIENPASNGASPETQFTYGADGKLDQVTQYVDGIARSTVYQYDSNGNLLLSRNADGDTSTWTYDAADQVLTQTTYGVADPNGSSPLDAASAMTTWYVYDLDERLAYTLSPTGDVTEYVYDSHGNRTSQIVFDGAQYNVSGLSTTDCPTLAQMTNWASEQNLTLTQRTDYTYDFRGNLSTKTVYTATSSSGAGAGTASTTQYLYDQYGRLLQEIDPRGIGSAPNASNSSLQYATTYTYDGLGRVLSETQWVSTGNTITTTDAYTDSTNTVTTTFANGLVTTKVYDDDGHLLSLTNSGPSSQALGTTTYQYDADGRLAITTDPTGIKQYYIYDTDGRKVGEVDLSGDGTASLTQYVYDSANDLIETVHYADYLSAATVATLTNSSGEPAQVSIATLVAALPTTVGRAYDQISRSVYDAAGQKVYDIDASGDVTQYAYDGAGRLTSETQYANPVSIASSVSLLTPSEVQVTASPTQDRKTSYFYDNNGQLVGRLDARGYLTQNTYDDAGQLTQTLAYATASPSVSYSGGTWSNLPAADPGQDELSAYFYDQEGRQVGQFEAAGTTVNGGTNGTGYFTQTQYDANNNVNTVTRYAQALSYTPGTSTDASLLAAAQAAAAQSGATAPRVTSYVYDGLNRLIQETNYQGVVTDYAYDAAGDLISTTVGVGSTNPSDPPRTTEAQYNALGEVTAQLSAVGAAQLATDTTQAEIDATWTNYGTSYQYDAAGRRISQTVTALDVATNTTQTETTLYFYNQAGQLRFTVNGDGDVTENQYNALGELAAQVSYFNAVSDPSELVGGVLTSGALAILTGIADSAKDKKTSYTYTLTGKVAGSTTAAGGSLTSSYNAFGQVQTSVTVVNASQGLDLIQNYTYDLDGDLASKQSDPTGADQVLTYGYDAFGHQTSVSSLVNQSTQTTSTEYDALGRVIATIDAVTNAANAANHTSATTSLTTYDGFSQVLTQTDALGNTTTYSYNDSAHSQTVTSPDKDSVTTTVYNNEGQILTVTTGTNTTTYAYDLNGEVTSVVDDIGTLETHTYDSAGNVLTSTDGNGTISAYTYDQANQVRSETVDPVTATNPNGLALKTSYVYDGEGQVTSTTNDQGIVTATTYDNGGRITQVVVDPSNSQTNYVGLNLTTTYAYDNEGDVVQETQGALSGNPRVTQYTYNAMGLRTEQVVDPGTGINPLTNLPYLNLTTQYFYDANGNLIHELQLNTQPDGTALNRSTWYVYDADNRLHYTVDSLGGITETDYDADGRVSATIRYATAMAVPAQSVNQLPAFTPVTSSADRMEQTFYNGDGQQEYSIDAAGTVTQSTYDSAGNVIQLRVINGTKLAGRFASTAAVTAALGNTVATTLGAQDRVQWTAYDARGRAVLTIDALGAVIATQYDGDGNVTATTAYATLVTPPSSFVTSLSASFPTNGNPPTITVNGGSPLTVTSSSTADRTTRYWYDTDGRQVYELNASNYLTQTQYNDSARTQTVTTYASQQTIPSGTTTSQLNAGTSIIKDPNGTTTYLVSENVGSTATSNTGVTVGADQATTTYYDAAGRVSQITDALNNNQYYGYDALGNKISYTNQLNQTWTYKYDAAGRLIEEDSPQVSVTSVSGGGVLTPNTEIGSIVTQMTYDAFGNIENLVEGTVDPSGGGTPDISNSRTTTYGYDALGRQTSVTLPKVPVYNGASQTEVEATGGSIGPNSTPQSPTTRVIYNTLGDEIASSDANGNWTYKVYDQLGRVTYEIDALGGVTGYTYDYFGNQTTTTRYATTLSSSSSGTPPASIASSDLTDLEVTNQSNGITTITATNGTTSTLFYVTQSGGQDRTITTYYDQDNRVKQVSQPAVISFVPTAGQAGGSLFTAPPTTFYDYNAFGQVVRTATLVSAPNAANLSASGIAEPGIANTQNQTTDSNNNTWAYTFTYYDQVGNKIANVDADGYLTTYQYDADRNLTTEYEYSQAVSGSTISQYTAGNTSSTTNRVTQYEYDKLNRKVAQVLESVQYTQMGGSGASLTATAETSGAWTFYAYDAVGNQTSVTTNVTTSTYYTESGTQEYVTSAATTYTYYDVLGRVIATVGPTSVQGDSSTDTVTPLTLTQRDVYGNVATQTQYAAGLTSANGLTSAPTSGPPTLANQNTRANPAEDRTTYYVRDLQGHALETEQLVTGGNVVVYDSYDADGNLVKQYQPANGTDTLETFYVYDALGRQTEIISPESLSGTVQISEQCIAYDVFGEVTSKGTDAYNPAYTATTNPAQPVYDVSFHYDSAGRVYLTNTGDGVYRAYLYDLAGNATGELEDQSTATASLSTLTSPSLVASAYQGYVNGNSAALMFTQTLYDAMGNVLEQWLPTYSSPSPEEAIDSYVSVQTDASSGITSLIWDAPADATLSPSLYIDGSSSPASFTKTPSTIGDEYGYEAEYSITGSGLSDGTHTYTIEYSRPDGTVTGITTGTFSVGQSLSIQSSSPGTVANVTAGLVGSNLVVSWAPDNTSVGATFSLLVGGTWQQATGALAESVETATLTAPGAGTYQYRITDTLNGVTEAQGTGTVTITAASTTTTLNVQPSATGTVGSISAGVGGNMATVSWTPDSDVSSPTFELLIGGTWTPYTVALSEGAASATFALPAAGTYQYRIVDLADGETEAESTGSIDFTTTLANTSTAEGSVSNIASSISGSTVTMSWTPDSGVTSSTFEILVNGTWTTPSVTYSENSYSASFTLPSSGTYQYRIMDLVNGATEAGSTGNLTYTAPISSTSLSNNAGTTGKVNSVSASVSGSLAVVEWIPDSSTVTSTTFYLLIGSTWTQETTNLSEGAATTSFALPAAGTYQYRITDLLSDGVTEAQGTGTITFTAASSSTSTSGSSTPAAEWYTPNPVSASATVGTQGSGYVYSSASPVRTPYYYESGVLEGYVDSWSGTDAVELTWLNLASGTYTLNVYYNTASNSSLGISSTSDSKSFTIGGGGGGYFSWTDTGEEDNAFPPGGISSISYFQILQNGSVVRDSRSAGVTTTTISWNAPSDTSFNGALYYRVSGTTTYSEVNASRSGGTFQASVSELAPGTYDYVAETFQNTAESPTNLASVSGQFVVASNSASIASQSGTPGYLSGVAVSGSSLTWAQAPESGAQVNVTLTGPASYNLTPSTSNGTNYSASFYDIPSGTYTYTINYVNGGSTYLEGTGTITINTTTTTTAATASIGTPAQLSAITGFTNLGNGVFGWTTLPNSTDGVTFTYYDNASGTWKDLSPSEVSSGGTTYESVNLSALPAGSYDYEVFYTASGAAQPYAEGFGTVTVGTATTAGTVSVGTPTFLSAISGFKDLGNGIFGWTTAPNGTDGTSFHYYNSTTGTWTTLGISAISSGGATYQTVNLGGLALGSYAYEVDYTASGANEPYSVGRGTVTITDTAAVSGATQLSAITGFKDLGNGLFGWTTAPADTDTPAFSYRVPATGATGTLSISQVSSGGTTYYAVNLSSIPGSPASIVYEVEYTASGAGTPYAVGWGGVGITVTNNPATVRVVAPTELSAIGGFTDLGNGVLGWTTLPNSTDSVTFHYTGSGSSGTLTASPVTVGGKTYYSVNLNQLPAGIDSITFEVDYSASGAAQPYAVGTGTVSVSDNGSTGTDTTSSWIASHAPTVAPHETQTVDRWGNVISSTNTALQTTNYTYNAYNELVTTTDPLVTAVSVAMASSGQTGTVSSSNNEFTSSNFYDLYGNLVGTQDADLNINATTNNVAGQAISEQHADGGQKFYVYDAFGDQIEVITQVVNGSSGLVSYYTRNAYDQAGRLTDTAQELVQGAFAATDAAGTTSDTGFTSNLAVLAGNQNFILNQYTYDEAGRRTASTDGAQDVTTSTYDLHGNVTSTTKPPNALGQLETTYYTYDLNDHEASETDPDGNTQTWNYSYFDQLQSHVDMGGTLYSYAYDPNGSGVLISMTSTAGGPNPNQFGGENRTYTYDSANHLIQIDDYGDNSVTKYEYDQAGRIERQETIDGGLIAGSGVGLVAEDTLTLYDAMGRVSGLYGLGFTVNYSYDKAGNRTEILAHYTTAVGKTSTQDLWYGYDQMNRVLISEGVNSGGTIGLQTSTPTQGTILTYDWRGDRTSATTQGTAITEYTTESGSGYTTDYASYNGTTDYTYSYDGAGRLIDTYTQLVGDSVSPPILTDHRTYDQASRLTSDTSYQLNSNDQLAPNEQLSDYNPDGSLNYSEATQNGQLLDMVYYTGTYTDESGVQHEVNFYDPAGNLMEYQVAVHDPNNNDIYAYLSTDTFSYEDGDSYLETSQSVNSAPQGEPNSTPVPGGTEYTYNVDQQLVQYTDTTKAGNNRDFLNNAQGQALVMVQGVDYPYQGGTAYGDNTEADADFQSALMSGPAFFQSDAGAQYFFFDSQGNSIGTYGELTGPNGPIMTANFDTNFTPISPQYPQAEPPQYAVQTGDTLALIAARVYGDPSLWYIIAQANGLTQEGPDTQLTSASGTPLAEGASLVIPNVVVDRANNASSFKPFDVSQALGNTTPYQANPPPPPQASGGGCGTFGQILVAAVALVVAAVFPELAPALNPALAAILGAAAGDVASQAVAIGIGQQNSFSWSQLGAAVLTAGLVPTPIPAGSTLTEIAEEAGEAALGSAVNQEVDVALGLQKSFSWEAVAAAAVAAPAAEYAGGTVAQDTQGTLDNVGANIAGRLTAAAINETAYAAFTGGRLNYAQIVADGFGNGIGDSIVQNLQQQDQNWSQILTNGAQVDSNGKLAPNASTQQSGFDSSLNWDGSGSFGGGNGDPTGNDVTDASGSSSSTTTDPLTNNEDSLAEPQLTPITVSDIPLPSPQLTFTVGAEGAQGMWGEAQSMLAAEGVTNPSNAQIEDMDKQLLSANPGVSTLLVGQQLNFPDGGTTVQGDQAYNTMDQGYEQQITANEMTARQAMGAAGTNIDFGASEISATNATQFTIPAANPLQTPLPGILSTQGGAPLINQSGAAESPASSSILSGVVGASDLIGGGLGLYTSATQALLDSQGIESAAFKVGGLTVKYGLPAVITDLPAGVGAAIGVGEAYAAYSQGNYAEAGEKLTSSGASLVGGTVGEIGAAALIGEGAALAEGTAVAVAATVGLPVVGALLLGAGAVIAYRYFTGYRPRE